MSDLNPKYKSTSEVNLIRRRPIHRRLHIKLHIKAQTDAQNAIRINGKSALGYIRLAQVSMDEGKWSDAIVILETGSRLEPQNEEIQNLMQDCKVGASQQKLKNQQKKELAHAAPINQKKSEQKETSTSTTSKKNIPAPSVMPKAIAVANHKNVPKCISELGHNKYHCSLCQVHVTGKLQCVQYHLRGQSHVAQIMSVVTAENNFFRQGSAHPLPPCILKLKQQYEYRCSLCQMPICGRCLIQCKKPFCHHRWIHHIRYCDL
eukprot:PhF_6_TR35751/c0_g2_i1/m.51924